VDGRSNKEIKYESPAGKPQVLDVPASVHPVLGDPRTPLWITEGARKADAAASIGIVCLSLAGVWSFRGTYPADGKVELPDFDAIAWNGREVYICFDSDVVDKKPVRGAVRRLAGILTRRGAQVRIVVLSSGPRGEKRGLDDVIAGGADKVALKALVQNDFFAAEDRAPIDIRLRDFILTHYDLSQDTEGNTFAVPPRRPAPGPAAPHRQAVAVPGGRLGLSGV
jgi:hypothetical protein